MPERSVGTIYLLKRTELAVRRCVEVALSQFELTPTQFLTLLRLRDTDGMSAAALAREIAVRPQSIVEIVAPLERKGLLKRTASPEHRRILQMRLTAAGRRLMADAMAAASKLEAELLEDLDAKQLATLQQCLNKLWARADRHDLHPVSARATAQRKQLSLPQQRRLRSRRASSN
jgi:DNA-binding MarR family transcriptional regulator